MATWWQQRGRVTFDWPQGERNAGNRLGWSRLIDREWPSWAKRTNFETLIDGQPDNLRSDGQNGFSQGIADKWFLPWRNLHRISRHLIPFIAFRIPKNDPKTIKNLPNWYKHETILILPMFFGKLYKTALERRRQLTIFFVAWLFDIDDLDVVSELVRDCSVFEMSFFQILDCQSVWSTTTYAFQALIWILPWQKLERKRLLHFHFWLVQYPTGT